MSDDESETSRLIFSKDEKLKVEAQTKSKCVYFFIYLTRNGLMDALLQRQPRFALILTA